MLEKRKWKTLCMPNTEACAIAVKEFYANCHWDDLDNPPEDNLYESFYRGCHVDFSPEALREFLQLPTVEEDNACFRRRQGSEALTYHGLMEKIPDNIKQDMKRLLVSLGGTWKDGSDGQSILVNKPDLAPKAKVWAHFLQDTVIPNSNKHECRRPLLVAMYCILRNLPMDVPSIISERILYHYNRNLKKDKPRPVYPSLITSLVRRKVEEKRTARPFMIQLRLKPAPTFTIQEMKRIHGPIQMGDEQPDPEAEQMPEPIQMEFPTEYPMHQGTSSSHPPAQEVPPAWAVAMHRDIKIVGGTMLHRMEAYHHDLQVMWERAGWDDPRYRGVQPYNELEREMMALSLQAGQEYQGSRRDENDPMDGE